MNNDKTFEVRYGAQDAKRWLYWLLAIELGLVAIFVLINIVLSNLRLGPIRMLFDLDRDLSIPGWFSAVQLFAASITLWAISRLEQPHKWFIKLGAAALLFLSIDEGAGIHEKVTGVAKSNDIEFLQALMISDHGAWVIPYLAMGALLVVVAIKPILAMLRTHSGPSLFAIAGGLLVVVGAVGLEVISYLFLRDGAGVAYLLEVAAEEFCEMFGISLIFYAILLFGIEVRTQTAAEPQARASRQNQRASSAQSKVSVAGLAGTPVQGP